MIGTQELLLEYSLRLEKAFARKYPNWSPIGLSGFVWESAAARLLEASHRRPEVPVDPELFVMSQPKNEITPDPWVELTQEGSLRFYLRSLRRIVRLLRREIKSEVRRAESRLRLGSTIDSILADSGPKLSPLSRYILARRAGRVDLSLKSLDAALSQHRSCPLYRIAARSLLPGQAYPSADLLVDYPPLSREMLTFSRN